MELHLRVLLEVARRHGPAAVTSRLKPVLLAGEAEVEVGDPQWRPPWVLLSVTTGPSVVIVGREASFPTSSRTFATTSSCLMPSAVPSLKKLVLRGLMVANAVGFCT